MDILETIDIYINAIVEFRTNVSEDSIQSLQANVNSSLETMRIELEKSDIKSLRMCIDALNQAIDSKRLEIEALSERYLLGVTQKNVAIINNDPFAEKRYDAMIEETLAQSRYAGAISAGYKDALKEVNTILNRGRN